MNDAAVQAEPHTAAPILNVTVAAGERTPAYCQKERAVGGGKWVLRNMLHPR